MIIVGLSVDVPTCSSAVLLENGCVLYGTPEERLNREKFSMKFPSLAVSYCLKARGIEIGDVDAFAVAWNPGINIVEATSGRMISTNRHHAEMLYTTPANLLALANAKPVYIKQELGLKEGGMDVYFVTHHACHAANAFYESGFREALIITCDGYGENETATVSVGKGTAIEKKSSTIFPNSLGMFYGTITEYLGFKHDSDEWKVMALGAYGTLKGGLYNKLRDLFSVGDDVTIKMDTDLFQFNNALTRGMYDHELVDYLGVLPRGRHDGYLREHFDLACATQKVFEDVMFELCRKARRRFKLHNLCVSGGSFMNSLFNGKLAASGLFRNVYIPFAPNDAGSAIGAAYYLYHNILKQKRPGRCAISPYIGSSYADKDVERVLKLYKCKYQGLDNVEAATAKLIAEGRIVGWFQGAMEFGERALGHRSILADPRNPLSKEKVNAVIKFREQFRPFAPSVLEEFAKEYFVLPSRGYETPYMEKVFLIRKAKQALIPSVTHADGTGRLQTVSRKTLPRYYKLIQEFRRLTGVPILLNTSLNRNGEPIVCSPEDALTVFYGSGLDYMVLHNYLVEK